MEGKAGSSLGGDRTPLRTAPKGSCVSCEQRKGKRICPALDDGQICPKCCGSKRIIEIRCPSDCKYLGHEKYQGERILSEGSSPLQDRYVRASYLGEDRFQAVLLVDMVVSEFLTENPDYPLAGVRDGLRYLRRLVSPIETPESVDGAFPIYLQDRLQPLLEQRLVKQDLLVEAADGTLEFFEREVQDEEALRSYLRFVSVFAKQGPRGDGDRSRSSRGPVGEGEEDTPEGGILIQP